MTCQNPLTRRVIEFLRGVMDERRDLIVAIDFGTSYSGFCVAEANAEQVDSGIHVFRDWDSDRGRSECRTPTCLLLTSEGRFHSFGHAAVQVYAKLKANRVKTDELLYFDLFKLVLYNAEDLNSEARIPAANGKLALALDLFALCLFYFKDKALETIAGQGRTVEPAQIQWVVTVPAIWKPTAKEFMRQAAYKAGLASPEDPHRLLIALESEAASFYCRSLQMKDFLGESGNKPVVECLLENNSSSYMTIDSGGGTLDIAVHEIQEDGSIREIHCPTGGLLGGMCVDREFQAMMCKIFGEDFVARFTEESLDEWLEMLNEFEVQKRIESGTDNGEVRVHLPSKLVEMYRKEEGEAASISDRLKMHYSPAQVSYSDDNYLHIHQEIIRALYQPVLTETVSMIRAVLSHPKLTTVNTLFMVGGFPQAPRFRRALAQAFPDKWTLTPRDAELAVMKGAVMFARSPGRLTARVMAKTYSIDINEKFDPTRHPIEKKNTVDGEAFCEGVLEELVRVDEQVMVGEKRSFFFSPVHPDQTSAILRFFSSESKDARFTTDPGVAAERVAFEVLSSDVTNGFSRDVELDVYFGGPEIKVTVSDVNSGDISKSALKLVTRILPCS